MSLLWFCDVSMKTLGHRVIVRAKRIGQNIVRIQPCITSPRMGASRRREIDCAGPGDSHRRNATPPFNNRIYGAFGGI
jgi:hypothetical protein